MTYKNYVATKTNGETVYIMFTVAHHLSVLLRWSVKDTMDCIWLYICENLTKNEKLAKKTLKFTTFSK